MDVDRTLAERVRAGESLLGTFVKSCDPMVTEILAGAGFDFLIADLEHSSLSLRDIEEIVRAAALSSVPVIVRVSSASLERAGRMLDAGAVGIQITDVVDAATVQRVCQVCSYPPDGTRSMSLAHRSAQFGRITAREHLARAGRELVLVGQVESIAGTEALPLLLDAGSRIDVWFLGALDLSVSLGEAGETADGRVAGVLRDAANTILAAGAMFGVFAQNTTEARAWIDQGASMVAISSDYGLLAKQSTSVTQTWHAEVAARHLTTTRSDGAVPGLEGTEA